MKCYKLIYKQFVQVSGLCGSQFPSYLPKHFTHHCRVLYGDANKIICVQFWCKNMAAGNKRKHLEFTFSIKALLSTRELAYVGINTFSNTKNG